MTQTDARHLWSWRLLALGVVGMVVVTAFGQRLAALLPALLATVKSLGPWASVAFITIYAVATVAWVPGSILTVAAGAMFGVAWGTAYTLVGATLGAALAFLLARTVARTAVKRRLDRDPRLRALDEALGREGPRLVLLLRLSPAFPFNALNYALGIMPVRFRDYLGMSIVGMAPGTLLYVYGGYAAGASVAGASGSGARSPVDYAFMGVGLIATVAVTALVTRAARKALAAAGAEDTTTVKGRYRALPPETAQRSRQTTSPYRK